MESIRIHTQKRDIWPSGKRAIMFDVKEFLQDAQKGAILAWSATLLSQVKNLERMADWSSL